MTVDGEKIQKYLASAGVGSRRSCEELVKELRVTINGVVAGTGDRVKPGDDVRLDGSRVKKRQPTFWKVYKPKGWLCTDDDSRDGRIVKKLLPPKTGRLFTVGRLDRDFEGLLVMTNDGDVAHRLMHPRYGITKLYEVRCPGFVSDDALEKIRKGIWLNEGRTAPMSVRVKSRSQKRTTITMNLTENRRRLIPRVFAKIGSPIDRVKRIGVGPIRLQGLKEGTCRKLDAREVGSLKSLLKKSP